MKELDSGMLKKGSLHTREFWEENYKEFELSNFEYIRRLVRFVQGNTIGEGQIEQQCIACFDLGEFARLYPGGASILEYFGAKDCLLKLIKYFIIALNITQLFLKTFHHYFLKTNKCSIF
jgi:V-type H+-transporting ATPase subunit H